MTRALHIGPPEMISGGPILILSPRDGKSAPDTKPAISKTNWR